MFYYSNEIVFRGHPDKVCDQISDALLDAFLEQDKTSRCGIEVCGGKNKIFITGEVTSKAAVNAEAVAKRVLKDCGYDYTKYTIINNLGIQSKDIAQGVDTGGAGDQGMMFGFACSDTDEKLPVAMVILQKFAMSYDYLSRTNPELFSDGKAQITGLYDDDFNLIEIKDFTISYQNSEEYRLLTDDMIKSVALSVCKDHNITVRNFYINPTGKFFIGGFNGDAGLTGRKIVVDNYQSFSNVGGGAFSGKDPTKVDRSGAYKARQIAVKYLTEHKLKWCEVQLSYAIGMKEPLGIYINSDKGRITPDKQLYKDCIPANIIKDLDLLNIKYENTAKYGHFTGSFKWDK